MEDRVQIGGRLGNKNTISGKLCFSFFVFQSLTNNLYNGILGVFNQAISQIALSCHAKINFVRFFLHPLESVWFFIGVPTYQIAGGGVSSLSGLASVSRLSRSMFMMTNRKINKPCLTSSNSKRDLLFLPSSRVYTKKNPNLYARDGVAKPETGILEIKSLRIAGHG